MHALITSTQARSLAAFVASIRPGWDIPGIAAALHTARHRAPVDELAIALIRLASRTDLRTPAVLAHDGPHWQGLPVAEARAPQRPKCPTHGLAIRVTDGQCASCRAEAIAADDTQTSAPTLRTTPAQIETTLRGVQAVRAAVTAARTTDRSQP